MQVNLKPVLHNIRVFELQIYEKRPGYARKLTIFNLLGYNKTLFLSWLALHQQIPAVEMPGYVAVGAAAA